MNQELKYKLFQSIIGSGNTITILNLNNASISNETKLLKSSYNFSKNVYANINTELKPFLKKRFEKTFEGTKCDIISRILCPIFNCNL